MCDDHVFIFLIRMGLIGKRKFMRFFFLGRIVGLCKKYYRIFRGNKTSSAFHNLHINIMLNVFSLYNCKVATCEVMQINVNN